MLVSRLHLYRRKPLTGHSVNRFNKAPTLLELLSKRIDNETSEDRGSKRDE